MKAKPPVIFIGMHRSGTSMLGRLLERLGLFVGARKDVNNESVLFQRLNEWLMCQAGARWDAPDAIKYLWEDDENLAWSEEYVRRFLRSPRAIDYLGAYRYLATRDICSLSMPWGWKDPRNTFTLPFWLRLFPDAKVLYIERHGVDVANSLRIRSRKSKSERVARYQKLWRLAFVRPKFGGFVESPRCSSLEGGFSLWGEYVDMASVLMHQLPSERVLKLRYEDVLEDPVGKIERAAVFCGLTLPSNGKSAITEAIDSGRAFSYRAEPALRRFADRHKLFLTERGYGERDEPRDPGL